MQGGGYGAQAPRGSVRHAYPLSVTSSGFLTAFALNMRTLPFAIVRFFMHLLHGIFGWTWVLASVALAVYVGSKVQPYLGIAAFVASVLLYALMWHGWFRYVLYGVKSAHVAVLTELITRGKLPSGSGSMLGYGRHVITERFGDVAQLYLFQMLVRLVVAEFTLGLTLLSGLMPFGIGFVARSGGRLVRASTRYLDEALFAYSLVRSSDPLWDASSEGLGYYFQNSKEMVKTSVWMVVLDILFRIVMWVVFGIAWSILLYGIALPILTAHAAGLQAWTGSDQPVNVVGLAVVAAAIGALIATGLTTSAIEQAFLRPIYLTMIITKFLNVIQSQPLDPSFEQHLGSRAGRLHSLAAQIDANRGLRTER